MSDRSGAPKEEGPTVEASHHPEIKVDPPDVKETADETLSRLRKNPVMTEIGKNNLVETLKNQIKGLSKRLMRRPMGRSFGKLQLC